MRRRSELYLRDILARADIIQQSLHGQSLRDVLSDADKADALLHRLTIIGEAAANLPSELRARYPEVDWYAIIGFRNRVVHAYFALDWSIVWNTAIHDVPILAEEIGRILEAEFSSERPADGSGDEDGRTSASSQEEGKGAATT